MGCVRLTSNCRISVAWQLKVDLGSKMVLTPDQEDTIRVSHGTYVYFLKVKQLSTLCWQPEKQFLFPIAVQKREAQYSVVDYFFTLTMLLLHFNGQYKPRFSDLLCKLSFPPSLIFHTIFATRGGSGCNILGGIKYLKILSNFLKFGHT